MRKWFRDGISRMGSCTWVSRHGLVVYVSIPGLLDSTFCNLLDICSLGTEYLQLRDPARYRRLFGTLPRFPDQSFSGKRALGRRFHQGH
jgi:hypothetical protein